MDFETRRQARWDYQAPARKANLHLRVFDDDVDNAQNAAADVANHVEEAVKQGRIPEYVGRELIREVWMIDGALAMYR